MRGMTGAAQLRAAMLAYAVASEAGDAAAQDRALQRVRAVVRRVPYDVRVEETPGILTWFVRVNVDLLREHGVQAPASFFYAVFGTDERGGIIRER